MENKTYIVKIQESNHRVTIVITIKIMNKVVVKLTQAYDPVPSEGSRSQGNSSHKGFSLYVVL